MSITHTHNHFCMSAVFAGTFIALAVTIVLSQFGLALGLSSETAFDADISLLSWNVIAVGIWLLWVQLISSILGGYAAGYLHAPQPDFKPYENEVIDGFYGLSTWALSTFIIFIGISLYALSAAFFATDGAEESITETLSNAEENSVIVYAFVTGATSLVSAVAAWWAATMAGDHRLKGTDFSKEISFKK